MWTSISSSGRYVAFANRSSAFIRPDHNGGHWDVYVRDTVLGVTERVSIGPNNQQMGDDSTAPALSADGQIVAFASYDNDTYPDDVNFDQDVFVRDMRKDETYRASTALGGGAGNAGSTTPSISASGRHVVFRSSASDLVTGDTNDAADIFVHDLATGLTTRASVPTGGTGESNGHSLEPTISADGTKVAFSSDASNLVPNDTNNVRDVFVHDVTTRVTKRVNVTSSGEQADTHRVFAEPRISGNGETVAFTSYASNLVPNDSNGEADVFSHELRSGITRAVSVSPDGGELIGGQGPTISLDGQKVAFLSSSGLLIHNAGTGRTVRAWDWGGFAALSGNGEFATLIGAMPNGQSPDDPQVLLISANARRPRLY